MFNSRAIPSAVALVTGGFSWRVVTASIVTKCFEWIRIGNLTPFSGSKSRENQVIVTIRLQSFSWECVAFRVRNSHS